VAALSRLELDDAELVELTQQLDAILGYVSKLDELDTEGVEPTVHVEAVSQPLRPDVLVPPLPREVVLAGAPASDGEYFVVPKVIG
jgi:aspartyl-tRNA(Asn)/glutamyl-tRNA(Gln) amidotransferase subunit C